MPAEPQTVTIYHNPRCNTSRKTLALIRARGIEPRVVEYLKTPPSASELAAILRRLAKPARALLRKKEAREAGIDPERLSEDALVAAMVAHPIVIERPIVVAAGKAALGRPPDAVLAIL
jgi:arsenate reductase